MNNCLSIDQSKLFTAVLEIHAKTDIFLETHFQKYNKFYTFIKFYQPSKTYISSNKQKNDLYKKSY